MATSGPLSPDQMGTVHAWWRAANYLSVGQISLLDSPLLSEALAPATASRDDDAACAERESPQLALDVYLHWLRAGIAAMSAALEGLDAVVFTGGIAEHSPDPRPRRPRAGVPRPGGRRSPERGRRPGS